MIPYSMYTLAKQMVLSRIIMRDGGREGGIVSLRGRGEGESGKEGVGGMGEREGKTVLDCNLSSDSVTHFLQHQADVFHPTLGRRIN